MLVSYKSAQPQKLPQEHEGKSEQELNELGFIICPEPPQIIPGQKLWWENNAWTIKEPNESEIAIQWQQVKTRRNTLLLESDMYVTFSGEIMQPIDVGVKQYRQALRDITLQPNPFDIVWPEPPVKIDNMWVGKILEINSEVIDQERNKRIDYGFTWNGNVIQADADSRENISGASAAAIAYLAAGGDPNTIFWTSPTTPFAWITRDNQIITLTAPQMIDMGNTALSHKKNHIFSARVLKDMVPIPEDFYDDKYWPTRPVENIQP